MITKLFTIIIFLFLASGLYIGLVTAGEVIDNVENGLSYNNGFDRQFVIDEELNLLSGILILLTVGTVAYLLLSQLVNYFVKHDAVKNEFIVDSSKDQSYIMDAVGMVEAARSGRGILARGDVRLVLIVNRSQHLDDDVRMHLRWLDDQIQRKHINAEIVDA